MGAGAQDDGDQSRCSDRLSVSTGLNLACQLSHTAWPQGGQGLSSCCPTTGSLCSERPRFPPENTQHREAETAPCPSCSAPERAPGAVWPLEGSGNSRPGKPTLQPRTGPSLDWPPGLAPAGTRLTWYGFSHWPEAWPRTHGCRELDTRAAGGRKGRWGWKALGPWGARGLLRGSACPHISPSKTTAGQTGSRCSSGTILLSPEPRDLVGQLPMELGPSTLPAPHSPNCPLSENSEGRR